MTYAERLRTTNLQAGRDADEEIARLNSKLEECAGAVMTYVDTVKRKNADLARLQESNDVKTRALKFYAEPMNYRWDGVPMTPFVEGKPPEEPLAKDFGAIARAALAATPRQSSEGVKRE